MTNLTIIGEQNCQKLDECLICAFLIWWVFVVFIFVIFVVSLSIYEQLRKIWSFAFLFFWRIDSVYIKAVVWAEAHDQKHELIITAKPKPGQSWRRGNRKDTLYCKRDLHSGSLFHFWFHYRTVMSGDTLSLTQSHDYTVISL